jgi:hypothetical protein
MYLLKGSRNLRHLVIENHQAARNMSTDALSNIGNIPRVVKNVKLGESRFPVRMVYLDYDRLYTWFDGFLHVYLFKALESPIARYQLKGQSFSCLVAENRLFLSSGYTLHVFDVKASFSQPLEAVTKIVMSSYP